MKLDQRTEDNLVNKYCVLEICGIFFHICMTNNGK